VRAAWVWGAFAILLAVAAAPVFSTVMPPLFDYPNHLARMHLLAESGNDYYTVNWAPLPNLAEDLAVPAMARFMPLDLAAKLFLILIFAATAGGAVWLGRAAGGEWRFWPLAGFLLLYSRTFLWGFLNYLAGVGVAICGAALWLRLEGKPWLRAVASCCVAFACYICHIEAFAVYALIILGIEAVPALAELRARDPRALLRRTAVAVPQFVVPALLFFAFWTPVASGGASSYAHFWRKADLLFTVFDLYHRTFDVICFALFLLLLGALAWYRRLGLDRRIGVAAALVFAAYLLLPSQLLSGSGADHRLPEVIFLLLIAGSTPRFPNQAAAIWAGIAVTAMLLVRLGTVEAVWLRSGPIYTQDLAALDSLPKGAKVAVAFPPSAVDMVPIPETHLPTLAVARRDAFVTTLFAYPAQQPIAVKPPFAALAESVDPSDVWAVFVELDAAKRARLLPLMAQFDFVLFTARDFIRVPTDPCLVPLHTTSPRFQIFRFAYAACSAG